MNKVPNCDRQNSYGWTVVLKIAEFSAKTTSPPCFWKVLKNNLTSSSPPYIWGEKHAKQGCWNQLKIEYLVVGGLYFHEIGPFFSMSKLLWETVVLKIGHILPNPAPPPWFRKFTHRPKLLHFGEKLRKKGSSYWMKLEYVVLVYLYVHEIGTFLPLSKVLWENGGLEVSKIVPKSKRSKKDAKRPPRVFDTQK